MCRVAAMPPCTFLLSKGLEHFFQCLTLLRGKPSQKFQKLLLFFRSEPGLRLRMILAVHKRYLLLSATSFSDCSKASLICSFAKAIRYSLMPFKMKSTFVPVMAMLPDRAFL